MVRRRWYTFISSLVLVGVVAGLVLIAPIARGILSADALNATSALALPAWLTDLTERSEIAYPAHAGLGTVLETLSLSPAATAVQWLKAAGHASSHTELERTAQGIATALLRDDSGRAFHSVCRLKDIGNAGQVWAVNHSGAPCDQWSPEVRLEAVARPIQATGGDSVAITVVVTSATDVVGIVDVEIHDVQETKVAQWVFSDQALAAGQPARYEVLWQIPPGLTAGVYEVKLGVFRPGWSRLHGWKRFAAIITVTP